MKTLRRLALPVAAILSATSPAAAQDTGTGSMEQAMDQTMAQLGEMFPVVPLTAEEQARLPAARGVVERIMPPGTMGEIMGSMFDNIMGPMTRMATQSATTALVQTLGIEPAAAMSEEQAAAALGLIDPAWKERREREAEIMPQVMTRVMTDMEPTMRAAMSELYAVYFDVEELADIDAFFATPSGASYARKSFRMSSDPRMMGAMMKEMPAMMGAFMAMGEEIERASADLPQKRSWADLDAAQRARLSELTGYDSEDLQYLLSEGD